MRYHLQHKHQIDLKAKERASDNTPSPSTSSTTKRGNTPYARLYELCPKKRRQGLFQDTIPNWMEAKSMLPFNSDKAQIIHKSIFEWMILDDIPFHAVSKPGFLRFVAVTKPNFEVASRKYYTDQLNPTFDRFVYIISIFK